MSLEMGCVGLRTLLGLTVLYHEQEGLELDRSEHSQVCTKRGQS